MNLYIREMTNKLALFNIKKIMKNIKFINNVYLRKVIKHIFKIVIMVKYNYFYYCGKIVENPQKNYVELLIPNKQKNNKNIINRWIKNLNKILKTGKFDNIIISERLKKLDKINCLSSVPYNTEGKKLLKYMLNDVIKYICNIRNERVENQTIYVLVNSYSKENLEILENLALSVKSLNIITQNLKRFLIFSNRIYEKEEVLITVSNNKRKALNRAKIIINIDFSDEIINKYNINRLSIFINLSPNSVNNIKGFSGIFINGLNIKEYNNIKNIGIKHSNLFNKTNFYESIIYNNYNLKSASEKIKEDKIEINFLIGKSGKIDISEYKKIA